MSSQPVVIKSAIKVLHALEFLCQSQQPVSLEVLTAHLEVTSATAYRIVNTLIEAGYAQTHGVRQGYTASPKVMSMGTSMLGSFNLRDEVRRAFRPVGMRFGETITVARLDGLSAVFIDKVRAGASLVFYCDVGRSLPLNIGAAGRCMLGFITEEEFDSVVTGHLSARTSATIITAKGLREAREKAKSDGYVLSVDEVDLGVSAIAVPLLEPGGRIIGAVAIANTSTAWSEGDRAERVAAMKTAATRVFDPTIESKAL